MRIRIPRLIPLMGAEEATTTNATTSTAPVTTSNVSTTEGWTGTKPAVTSDPEKEPDSFSREYVEKVRSESAGYRTKLRETESQLEALAAKVKEFEKAQMSEAEKLKTEAEEYKEKFSSLQTEVTRLKYESTVTAVAAGQNFNDPRDALELIDKSELEYEDGVPTEKSVKKALKALVDSKPYLIRQGSFGSADGGPRSPSTETFQDKVRRYADERIKAGAVPRTR